MTVKVPLQELLHRMFLDKGPKTSAFTSSGGESLFLPQLPSGSAAAHLCPKGCELNVKKQDASEGRDDLDLLVPEGADVGGGVLALSPAHLALSLEKVKRCLQEAPSTAFRVENSAPEPGQTLPANGVRPGGGWSP